MSNAKVYTFESGLPAPRSSRDRLLRRQLTDPDRARAADAALELGSAYLAATPRPAAALLRRAAQGPPLVAGRALLRLARVASEEPDLSDSRRRTRVIDLLDQAQRVTAPALTTDDGVLRQPVAALRIDIAAALRFAGATDAALTMLIALDQQIKRSLDLSGDGDEIRRLAALTCLRLGQTLFEDDPHAADRHLERSVGLGTATVRAEAAFERAALLQHHASGAGPDVERHYLIAADEQDPVITPRALVALGDFLWESGRRDVAREQWQRAGVLGDDDIVRRVARRLEGAWQHERAARRLQTRTRVLDFARPIDDVVPHTDLGRMATGRAADAPRDEREERPVAVVGAGTGAHYLRPALHHGYRIVGYVDDAPTVSAIDGVPVTRGIDRLGELLRDHPEVRQVVFAIPSAPGVARLRTLATADRRGCEVVSLPSMFELRYGHPLQPQLRPFDVHETFGQRPWLVDRNAHRLVQGRRVAIVGASSVLGAEMARRVAHGHARHLLLVDEPAQPLLDLAAEIRDLRGFQDCDARIVDYAAEAELREALTTQRPPCTIFFCGGVQHASEPELRPRHALRANTLAVDVVARVAAQLGCSDLVVASMDRAAHRSHAFDMTKALAERAALRENRHGGSRDDARSRTLGIVGADRGLRVSVLRTPNLWARRGAVIGRLTDQLASGGPLRVRTTRRRFTPAWDAAQTMLRLLDEGHDGGLFAMTSYEEVEIRELAERLLLINGLRPGRDIRIVTVDGADTKAGLELWGKGEVCREAVVADAVRVEPARELEQRLDELLARALSGSLRALRPHVPIDGTERGHATVA